MVYTAIPAIRSKKADPDSHKRLKGSYTIEAAVLIPLALWVTVILMFGAFWEYNLLCMYQGTYSAALGGALKGGDAAAGQQEAEERLDRYIRENLWMVQHVEQETETGYLSIKTGASGNLRVPADSSLFDTLWRLEAESTVDRLRPVTFIRACNKAESVLEWLKEGETQNPIEDQSGKGTVSL